MTERRDYSGPALFSGGFRPFFLAATLFGLCVVPVWLFVWRGDIALAGPFPAIDWHVHEMIFGYGAAVLAGFLFTAVPNWTGRMPARGWPLALLLLLWLAGRMAVWGALGIPGIGVFFVDQAFLLAVVAMIVREIVAGRNWRNLRVVIPVALLWVTNVAFHFQVMSDGSTEAVRRLGIAILVFLIMLIGGRIVPSFTRNWLAKAGIQRMPVPPNRFDALCIAVGVVALLIWSLAPEAVATAIIASVAAALHLARLLRWRGVATWRSPLLWMLHVAYLTIPFGLLAAAVAAMGWVGASVPVHVFGIGAVGGMTVAVMMRATMGHTGRALSAGPVLTTAFAFVLAATITRIAGTMEFWPGVDGILLAGVFWTAAFALLVFRLAPWLLREKEARRSPNGRAPAQ
ncbi:NnrS family protein [Tropicimonas isoalkanivorans]|uniref:Uncharacterized protein involved in response to NO n=1 Tax=Tropicimonas isoalkanivorans TaxID=441112 RepID=A0A1I1HU23_9RHOB|nr:NnrS family protein [Tropicimonas isoalkanivorans]SFC24943.1 uncharacterized protein involved in response to NO [Tropicimonas isoalkanivorans]